MFTFKGESLDSPIKDNYSLQSSHFLYLIEAAGLSRMEVIF